MELWTHVARITSLAVSANGQILASGDEQGNLKLLVLRLLDQMIITQTSREKTSKKKGGHNSGSSLPTFSEFLPEYKLTTKAHGGPIFAIEWLPVPSLPQSEDQGEGSGSRRTRYYSLATGSADRAVRLWMISCSSAQGLTFAPMMVLDTLSTHVLSLHACVFVEEMSTAERALVQFRASSSSSSSTSTSYTSSTPFTKISAYLAAGTNAGAVYVWKIDLQEAFGVMTGERPTRLLDDGSKLHSLLQSSDRPIVSVALSTARDASIRGHESRVVLATTDTQACVRTHKETELVDADSLELAGVVTGGSSKKKMKESIVASRGPITLCGDAYFESMVISCVFQEQSSVKSDDLWMASPMQANQGSRLLIATTDGRKHIIDSDAAFYPRQTLSSSSSSSASSSSSSSLLAAIMPRVFSSEGNSNAPPTTTPSSAAPSLDRQTSPVAPQSFSPITEAQQQQQQHQPQQLQQQNQQPQQPQPQQRQYKEEVRDQLQSPQLSQQHQQQQLQAQSSNKLRENEAPVSAHVRFQTSPNENKGSTKASSSSSSSSSYSSSSSSTSTATATATATEDVQEEDEEPRAAPPPTPSSSFPSSSPPTSPGEAQQFAAAIARGKDNATKSAQPPPAGSFRSTSSSSSSSSAASTSTSRAPTISAVNHAIEAVAGVQKRANSPAPKAPAPSNSSSRSKSPAVARERSRSGGEGGEFDEFFADENAIPLTSSEPNESFLPPSAPPKSEFADPSVLSSKRLYEQMKKLEQVLEDDENISVATIDTTSSARRAAARVVDAPTHVPRYDSRGLTNLMSEANDARLAPSQVKKSKKQVDQQWLFRRNNGGPSASDLRHLVTPDPAVPLKIQYSQTPSSATGLFCSTDSNSLLPKFRLDLPLDEAFGHLDAAQQWADGAYASEREASRRSVMLAGISKF